jgi:WS/DGAT/MGAT family acyltransferase
MVESGWLLLDKPQSPMHVSSLLLLKKSRPYEVLKYWRERWRSQSPVSPFNFVWRRSLQYPLGGWEPQAEFIFDDHIRGLALAPGENSPEHLHQLAAWLHSLPLEKDRPLWQLFVIEGLPDQQYAVLIKIHHALTDGVFAMGLLEHMLSPSAEEHCEKPFWSQALHGAANHRAPMTWSQSLKNLAPLAKGMGQGLLYMRRQHQPMKWPYQASPSPLNQEITARRHLEVMTLPLSAVREWAHEHDATLNDTLLCLTGMALHDYFQEQHQEEPESLHALVPVSLRSIEQNDPGCRLGFAVADLGPQHANIEERLVQVKRSTEAAKSFLENFNPVQKQLLTSVLDLVYVGSQTVPGLQRRLPPLANLLVSNVVGPRQTLYFNGDPLEEIIPLSILADGQGLNVTALSYHDKLTLSCVCCPDVVPNPYLLREGFAAAWDELQRSGQAAERILH